MVKKITYLILCLLLFNNTFTNGQSIIFSGNDRLIGTNASIAEDATNKLTLTDIISKGRFTPSTVETPNLGLSNSTFWIRFSVVNNTRENKLYFELAYPLIQSCDLYILQKNKIDSQAVVENGSFTQRLIRHQNIVLPIIIPPADTASCFLKIKSDKQIVLPLILHTPDGFFRSSQLIEILTGIFIGILVVMILYNLFIYFSIRERSYLYYVLYIISIGFAQCTLLGYTYKYLWPNNPGFDNFAIVLFSSAAGIFAILFIKYFLDTRQKVPVLDKLLAVIIFLYLIAIVTVLLFNDVVSFRILDVSGLLGSLLTFTIALKLSIHGYRPAKFFLLAWSIFLMGLILFVMRNFNILPYNIFTNYTMQLGTALEVILLSFALADKINILKKEKQESQEEALRVSLENQRIIKEQNIVLEQKVIERTEQLTMTNSELNITLSQLKSAQSKLVDAEKMASLGQLTAGIAHEINNPINFVSSNIKPLRRDIADLMTILHNYDEKITGATDINEVKARLKEIDQLKTELDLTYIQTEIDMLLNGMEDGSNRTVEIVRGLKVFSRVDESDLKFANINDGINSTLIILNNQMGSKLKLVKNLGNLPDIECFAGKLNQVFMNILSNAIYATQSNPAGKPEMIWVSTSMADEQHVRINIRDNGIGMPPEIKNKIFEPFFTTKDVGKGTGLGLSIVFQIIEMHNGKIEVISNPGEGTEFIIDLPVYHKTTKS